MTKPRAKILEQVRDLVARATHPGTEIEEQRTCALIAWGMLVKAGLLEEVLSPKRAAREPSSWEPRPCARCGAPNWTVFCMECGADNSREDDPPRPAPRRPRRRRAPPAERPSAGGFSERIRNYTHAGAPRRSGVGFEVFHRAVQGGEACSYCGRSYSEGEVFLSSSTGSTHVGCGSFWSGTG